MPLEQWETESFEIISISPADGLLAVYAEEDPDNPGFHILKSYPVHFIGVARVTTKYWAREQNRGPAMVGTEIHKRVVGIDLSDGYFTPCDEASNFSGIARAGDDIRNAIGMLNLNKYPLSPSSRPVRD